MPSIKIGLVLAMTLATTLAATAAPAAAKERWAIALHGGAGVMDRTLMTPEMSGVHKAALAKALKAGTDVLEKGGSSLDAVEAAIRVLEDDPLFNAGRGAVFSTEGRNELDASIMDGTTLKAGAVASVTHTRHPISLARAVMEKSPHVMLIGEGAETFGRSEGLEQVDPSYFFTERRWRDLEKKLKERGEPMPPRPAGAPPPPQAGLEGADRLMDDHRFGTVGVVALDEAGNIAAGTSTGGTGAKRWGRVGDSPIIGAGTYASKDSCAVSGTGTGEFFIRLTVAREICALVQYEQMPLQKAADEVIRKRLTALGGDGGVVAIDPKGHIAWSFNTPGMFRAKASSSNPTPVVGVFDNEP